MSLKKFLPLDHVLNDLLNVNNFEAVDISKKFGDGLFPRFSWACNTEIGHLGQAWQFLKVYSWKIHEAVEIILIVKDKDSASILGCKLKFPCN